MEDINRNKTIIEVMFKIDNIKVKMLLFTIRWYKFKTF